MTGMDRPMGFEVDAAGARSTAHLALLDALVEIGRGLSQVTSEDDILLAMARYAELQGAASMEISYLFHDGDGRPDGTEIVSAWAGGALVPEHPLRNVRFKFDSFSVSSIWYSSPHDVLLVDDVTTDPRLDDALRSLFTEQLKKRAFALLPLYSKSGGRWLGLLTLTWTEPHAASPEERLVYALLTQTITAVVAGRRAIAGRDEALAETRRSAEERARMQEDLIRAQAAALAERSTPLIPISDAVVVVPIVGSIDVERGRTLMETLLDGVSRSQARFVILDLTGARTIDAQAAGALSGAARALRLLGVEPVLTGIRPEMAQAWVGLGVELEGIVTLGTLQSGIAYASRSMGRRAP